MLFKISLMKFILRIGTIMKYGAFKIEETNINNLF